MTQGLGSKECGIKETVLNITNIQSNIKVTSYEINESEGSSLTIGSNGETY